MSLLGWQLPDFSMQRVSSLIIAGISNIIIYRRCLSHLAEEKARSCATTSEQERDRRGRAGAGRGARRYLYSGQLGSQN